jgi:hypothetical protein
LAEVCAADHQDQARELFVNLQTVKPLAPVRPSRSTQNQPDLSRLMRRIVTDAVSRMALIDADRRGPQSNSASTWQASRA